MNIVATPETSRTHERAAGSLGNQPRSRTRSRLLLLALMALFMIPALMANLAYHQGWLLGGQTNYGQLVPVGVSLSLPAETVGWRLLVVPAAGGNQCDAACAQARFVTDQVRLTLGREMDKVTVLTLTAEQLSAADWQQLAAQAGGSQIYLADPAGNLVLRYPAVADREQMISDGRGMRKDLKRILKYSRAQ